VANAVGCTESYISQLLADEAFAQQVMSIRLQSLTAATNRDQKIDDIEDQLLEKLKESIPLVYKINDIARLFSLVNRAERRGVSAPMTQGQQSTVVQLMLPERVAQKFVRTPAGEIVEVDGQTLVTMPAHKLLQNLAAQHAAKQVEDGGSKDDPGGQQSSDPRAGNIYEKALKYIPAGIESAGDGDEPREKNY
jgi:hypothetical protein